MTSSIAKRYGLGFTYGEETPERRVDKYYRALGEFVSTFANVEASMHLAFWHYAKTPMPIARAVFSGFKIDQQINLMKRLTEARRINEKRRSDLLYICAQLGVINSARNDILHFGARYAQIAEGRGVVSNELMALTPERLKEFPISAETLDHMKADCVKILVHLHTRHMGRGAALHRGTGSTTKSDVEAFLRRPWRYKHALKQTPRPPKPSRLGGSKAQAL